MLTSGKEITCSATGWDPTRESDPSKVGELNPNIEAKLVDDDGKEVADGERGELLIRGPNVMKGYWKKPDATKDTMTEDGWLKTGDIAIYHSDGCLSIVDRKKVCVARIAERGDGDVADGLSLFVTGIDQSQGQPACSCRTGGTASGASRNLRRCRYRRDSVSMTGGRRYIDQTNKTRDRSGEEKPRAYVVLQQGQSASPEDIASWLAERVTSYKRLTGGVKLVKEIPKNPSGKILRKILREQAKEELEKGGGRRESKL